jgi:hypothetical protein
MAERPPARRSDRGSWEPGYRNEDTWDGGGRDDGAWDGYYRDAGYRDPGYRDADYRDADYRHAGYRGRHDGGRAGGAGQDRRSWDDAWAWDDEDADVDGYRASGHGRDTTGGAEGNERLTALTGCVLLVLFAAEGFTILSVHRLLTLHFFLGMLLIGPVLLKVCAVLYRFVRYYTGAEEYRRKGPPAPLLRLLGPVVMITSLSVVGTGVMLAIAGPSGAGTWLFLHKASFVLWFCAMTVHVLAYVWRLPRMISGDLVTRASYRAQEVLAGRPARFLLLAASLLTGLLLAMVTVHRSGIWLGVGH